MTDLQQLARDVEELREDIDYLSTLLEPHLASAGRVTAAAAATLATAAASGPAARPTAAHVWHTLTGLEAAQAWTTLCTWVDWLTDRYALDDTIPACWYRHGALVDELDALRAAWTSAYLNPQAAPGDAANWLELLGRTVIRIREWDRYGCAAGTHHDDPPSTREPADRSTRGEYLQTDIENRIRAHHPAPERDEPAS